MAEWNLKANDIFVRAAEIGLPHERRRFLERECGGDADLLAQVESLLAAGGGMGSFLEKPAAPALATAAGPITEGPNAVIGPYRLMEQIGEGGFGLVFVAEQQAPVRRKVALKVIKPGMDTRDVIARFEAERQALALMDHPNIAKVLDAGATDSGRPYFVMELVKGIPLTDYCDQNQLTPRERLGLFVSVCQAVQHAHTKGIIHRDLKPSNILVTLHDGTPVVKVIDFGVAKAIGQHLTDKTIYTRFSQMIGTPLYMSPEQAEMSGLDIDTRSDIYALAVLLYELLTGTTPFDSERLKKAALDEIRRIIREEEPPRPSTRLSTLGATLPAVSARRKMEPGKLSALVRGDLDWIVMKGLEKDRTRRYETASAFAADVKRYLREEAIEARPPSAGYRLRKFVKRNRGPVVAAALVLSALLAGIVGTTWGMVEALWQRDEAELARKGEGEQRLAALANAQKANDNAVLAQGNEIEATKQRDQARAAREHLRRTLYASNLNLIPAAWEANNGARILELLDETRPGKDEEDLRGFEWHYWNRMCHADLRTLQFGTLTRQHAVFSPDGARYAALLAADNQPGVVKVWDVATGQEMIALPLDFQRSSQDRSYLSFSQDGKRLALAATSTPEATLGEPKGGGRRTVLDGRLVIWDLASGKELFAKKVPFAIPALSPDGERACAGGSVWEVATGKQLLALFPERLPRDFGGIQTAFSPDGARLGSASSSGIRIWDAATGEIRMKALKDLPNVLFADVVSFSPDGTRLAAFGGPRSTATLLEKQIVQGYVFDAFTGEKLLTVQAPPGAPSRGLVGVERLVFSHDGQRLAGSFTCESSVVRIFDARTGAIRLTLKGHTDSIDTLAFSADGRRLYSADRKGTVKVWDIMRDDEEPKQHAFDGTTIVISADGTRSAEFARGGLGPNKDVPRLDAIIRDRAGEPIHCFTGHTAAIFSLQLSPDGRFAVSYDKDGNQKFWETATGKVLLHQQWPATVDDSYDFTNNFRPTIGGPGASPKTTKDRFFTDVPVRARPIFSSDGSRLAAGVPGGGIKVWDLAGFKEVYAFKSVSGFLHLSRSSCRVHLAEDGAWQFWDVAADKKFVVSLGGLEVFSDQISDLTVSPDGNCLAMVRYPKDELPRHKLPVSRFLDSRGYHVQVWDTRTGETVATLTSNVPLGGPGRSSPGSLMAFSPDGTRLAAPSRFLFPQAPSEVLIWEIPSSKELFRLKGHSASVVNIAFSPDGKRIATAASGEVKLWDSATGKELLSLKVAEGPLRTGRGPSTAGVVLAADEFFFSRDGARLLMQNNSSFSSPISERWSRPLVWDATPLPEKR
jgi:serine/threonine protein kinase/WD40 repeat protein